MNEEVKTQEVSKLVVPEGTVSKDSKASPVAGEAEVSKEA